MSATTDTPVAPQAGPRYYRSFASYEIPFHPVEPVAFADTEGLRAFYAAYHDSDGRIIRFDKLRLVRVEAEPREVELLAAEEPGTALYFAVVPDSPGAPPGVGKRFEYSETENLDEFYAGTVEPSGSSGKVTRFRREIAFTDSYAYWPSGELRTRIMTGPGQPPTGENYDADGRKSFGRIPPREGHPEEQDKEKVSGMAPRIVS